MQTARNQDPVDVFSGSSASAEVLKRRTSRTYGKKSGNSSCRRSPDRVNPFRHFPLGLAMCRMRHGPAEHHAFAPSTKAAIAEDPKVTGKGHGLQARTWPTASRTPLLLQSVRLNIRATPPNVCQGSHNSTGGAAQVCSNSSRNSLRSRSTSTTAVGRFRAGRCRPKSQRVWLKSSKMRSLRSIWFMANDALKCLNVGQLWPKSTDFGRCKENSARSRPQIWQFRAELARKLKKSAAFRKVAPPWLWNAHQPRPQAERANKADNLWECPEGRG